MASSTSIILNCANTGKVVNLGTGKDSKSGGVAGWVGNAATVNCANYGEVDSADNGQTAGVTAYIGNTTGILNSINTGKVKGGDYVGGITGYSNGTDRYIVNCVNLGETSSNSNKFGGIIGWARSAEKITNCFNLSTAQAQFAMGAANPVDPADATTHASLVITNSANLDTVDAIFNAIEAAAPGVFAKTADGTSIVLAGN